MFSARVDISVLLFSHLTNPIPTLTVYTAILVFSTLHLLFLASSAASFVINLDHIELSRVIPLI